MQIVLFALGIHGSESAKPHQLVADRDQCETLQARATR